MSRFNNTKNNTKIREFDVSVLEKEIRCIYAEVLGD